MRAPPTTARWMPKNLTITGIAIIVTTATRTIMESPTMTTREMTITDITTVILMLMTTSKPEPPKPGDVMGSDAAALYRLLTWLSPAFPVGGFSYSSGIEWAVEAGDIHDAASLQDWLAAMLSDGSGFCDGVFLSHAHRAVELGDAVALRDVAELAAAFVPSRERQLETLSQGRAFVEAARAAWNCPDLERAMAHCDASIVYPIAVGLVSAAHGVPLAPTLHAFLHAVTSNWTSAGCRLIPLGQTDSQRILASLEPVVATTAGRAGAASLDDLGAATFRADLASLRHETQYTRLFRS